jgi:hypothetical protein
VGGIKRALLLTLLLPVGCSGISTGYDYDPTPEQSTKIVNGAVGKLLREFPPD